MLTPITITGTFINPDGSAPTGALQFTLSDSDGQTGMTDSGTGEMVLPLVIVGQVNNGQLLMQAPGGGGYVPLTLLANDDPTTEPAGTYYEVTENLGAALSLPDWQFTVHHAAVDGTEDISSQRPVP